MIQNKYTNLIEFLEDIKHQCEELTIFAKKNGLYVSLKGFDDIFTGKTTKSVFVKNNCATMSLDNEAQDLKVTVFLDLERSTIYEIRTEHYIINFKMPK